MPREKIMKMGVESLDDYELLAVLLQTGTKKEPIIEFSKRILKELSGLDQMVNMSIDDWMKIKGIKECKASKMIAFLEFSKRIYQYNKEVTFLRNEKEVYDYIKYDLFGLAHEELYVLYVNVKCHLITKKRVSKGKVNIVYVDIKDVVNDAIRFKASGVFIIHNHPSGDVNPSNNDVDLTNSLKKALGFFDVNLLDHLIIGNNKYFSFNSNNMV